MFEVEYRGGNAVVITTKKSTMVVDAGRTKIGLKDIVIKDAVELATEKTFLTHAPEYKASIEGPGEYEVSGFTIRGIATHRHLDDPNSPEKNSNIYNVTAGDTRLVIVGNIHPDLVESQIDDIGIIDVLIIPVGGNGYTLDATAAATITRKIDPKIVVPVHYHDPSLQYEVPQNPVDLFINELKAPVIEDKKLKIKSSADLVESLEIYKLALNK